MTVGLRIQYTRDAQVVKVRVHNVALRLHGLACVTYRPKCAYCTAFYCSSIGPNELRIIWSRVFSEQSTEYLQWPFQHYHTCYHFCLRHCSHPLDVHSWWSPTRWNVEPASSPHSLHCLYSWVWHTCFVVVMETRRDKVSLSYGIVLASSDVCAKYSPVCLPYVYEPKSAKASNLTKFSNWDFLLHAFIWYVINTRKSFITIK